MTHLKSLILFGLVLLASQSIAQSDSKTEKMKEKLVGTWQYRWLFKSNGDTQQTTDNCEKNIQYTFNTDGTVIFNNINDKECAIVSGTKARWSVVRTKCVEGWDYLALRIFEEGTPERSSYEGNTYNDQIFLLCKVKGKFLQWIKKPQYKTASDIEWQVVMDKVK
jgi:hypothetical protein